eukprot:7233087-Alexandrium_andersonii.AAC.1
MPHSYAFKVVAVDTTYVDYLSRRAPYLNMVCHGANFQQVRRLDQPTSELQQQLDRLLRSSRGLAVRRRPGVREDLRGRGGDVGHHDARLQQRVT